MDYLTIALPKGKLFDKSVQILAKVGVSADNVVEDSRKLVITNEDTKVRFIIVKTMDLPTYVEYGAADIGIIGKDVLIEENKDVYELLDMGYGKCHLMMALPASKVLPNIMDYTHMRVATKYPNSATAFFDKMGMQMEIIKLNGSIELAPIVGLSELIVDIVETGTTLRENNLKEVAMVYPSSARLIANKVSFRLQHQRIKKLVRDLKKVLKEEPVT
ncbi:MAG: ATP phosphoribosyltransferase [Acidaminococcus sp.]|jgi:ATP phosphoribosyltransferase|nr:ATP phosphoribosyltransferase [Acidaminococcus sp.]MCI2116426.1 ATP phosphoribosyltransferase [Acidaminococcus sp.]